MSILPQNPARTKEEKEAIYQEWQSSGLSKKEFCIQKSLNYQTFIWWFASKKRKAENQSKGIFVPVVVEPSSQSLHIEIQLSGSRKIILSGTPALDIIQAILRC